MTATTASVDHLLGLIHQTGYWRVAIHSTAFERQRISSLADCWRIVEESRVSQRGWDYPYLDRTQRVFEDDWVQCGVEWANHVELWRFYQSGQFVHQFAVTEDREPPSLMGNQRGPSQMVDGPRRLSFLNLLYTVTEILEFARRLAHHETLDPAATVRIELHGMRDRQLIAPLSRLLPDNYVSRGDTICWERTTPSAALIATAPALAIDATIHILERFRWDDVSRRLLEDDQARFYQRQW
ncbi:MAG: hypothetical protein ACRDJE_07440 [Dehalococcoidia bacterium]